MDRAEPEPHRGTDARLVDGVGLWLERLTVQDWAGRQALFLDRDGVIVEETQYLGRPEDVKLIDGAAAAIRMINEAGCPVVVVTNQAGIGRGYYDWIAFAAVQARIRALLAQEGATIDLVLACAYHDKAVGAFACHDHPWRKPRPGMMSAAGRELGIDLGGSLVVGDKISDLEAGWNAGLRRGVLVETGWGKSEYVVLRPAALSPMNITLAADIKAGLAYALSTGWPSHAANLTSG